jgi:formate dehydrogenase iron-sulfur subunit
VFAFGAAESCGKCTPCRLGAHDVERHFADAGSNTNRFSRERWRSLIALLEDASLCGHGSGLGEFAASVERYYASEIGSWLA